MANNNTYNAASVVLIIAAAFGILSFFVGWFVFDAILVEAPNWSISGYGMLDNVVKDYFGGNAYIPLYILILSAITLLVAFLPKLGVNIPAPRYSVMLIILGLAILILAIVWGCGQYSADPAFKLATAVSGFSHAGAGFWFAIISGLLTIFIGALPALTKKV